VNTNKIDFVSREKIEYKNYSLEKLSEFISDALQSEATPTEIYNTIITTLKKEVEYHDVCKKQAQDILDLMQNKDDTNLNLDKLYGKSFISAAFNDTISLEDENKSIKFPSRY